MRIGSHILACSLLVNMKQEIILISKAELEIFINDAIMWMSKTSNFKNESLEMNPPREFHLAEK